MHIADSCVGTIRPWSLTMRANTNLRALILWAAPIFAATAASAAITPIGQFTGQYQESFDNFSFNWTSGSVPVFSGLASVHERSNGSIIVTNSWSFNTIVSPRDGTKFMGSPSSWVQYDFNIPVIAFGGFFTTNTTTSNGQVQFFLNGQLLSTQSLAAPKTGEWTWNGWSSPTGFDSVRVISNFSSGGFIMQDSLQATSIPVPGTAAACGLVLLASLRRRSRAA